MIHFSVEHFPLHYTAQKCSGSLIPEAQIYGVLCKLLMLHLNDKNGERLNYQVPQLDTVGLDTAGLVSEVGGKKTQEN